MTPSPSPKVFYTEAQRREAADWFVVIHDEDDPKADTLQAWLRWMEADECNRLAFESVAHAWHATPAFSALAMPSAEELRADRYEGDQPVDEWLATHHPAMPDGEAPRANHRLDFGSPAHRRVWLAAASLVALIFSLTAMNRYLNWHRPQTDDFVTKTGEQTEITLADGSRVCLGPKSKLLVEFTKERRNVQLPMGEAFFSVMKDHSRPFIVHSSSGDITAVGTAFNVRSVADHVTVAVSEGVVIVAPTTQLEVREPPAVRVASGQQLTFTAREPTKALAVTESPALGERARWRDGVLIYRDEPLRDVVMDVARYSNKQLEISDDAVGNLHYSGIVYQGAVDEWASALPESFPVKVISEGAREIIAAR
jgi:transmembrane sensor